MEYLFSEIYTNWALNCAYTFFIILFIRNSLHILSISLHEMFCQ